jgi:uncharacterized membrane protein YgcG
MAPLALYALLAVLNVVITTPVVDQAGVLPPPARDQIEARVRTLRAQTGVQLAVLTVPTTDGEPVAEFSHRIASAWGGGRKGRDDGLLLTLVVDDRKVRLEVGYGLEARLPDVTARHILEAGRADLQQKRYAAALGQIVSQIEAYLQVARATEDSAAPAAAAQATAPAGAPDYPLVVPFRADPVVPPPPAPPEPLPPLGLLGMAPLGGLFLGYALGSLRARKRDVLVDLLAFFALGALALALYNMGPGDRRNHVLVMSLGGVGLSAMLVRGWGLTRYGCVMAAGIGTVVAAGALFLQAVVDGRVLTQVAAWYRCLVYSLGCGAAAQALVGVYVSMPPRVRSWWSAERARDPSESAWSSTGSGGSGGGWSRDDDRGGGGGGGDWGGGGGGFGGGGSDMSF